MRAASCLTWALTLALIIFGFVPADAATTANEARIGVKIHVPVVQQLTIIEPVTISLPHSSDRSLEPLVFERIGKIVVTSNAHWALTVQTLHGHNIPLYLKPSGDRHASWTDVSSGPAVYTGAPGSQVFSWDIRVAPPQEPMASEEQIELLFTLTHL